MKHRLFTILLALGSCVGTAFAQFGEWPTLRVFLQGAGFFLYHDQRFDSRLRAWGSALRDFQLLPHCSRPLSVGRRTEGKQKARTTCKLGKRKTYPRTPREDRAPASATLTSIPPENSTSKAVPPSRAETSSAPPGNDNTENSKDGDLKSPQRETRRREFSGVLG